MAGFDHPIVAILFTGRYFSVLAGLWFLAQHPVVVWPGVAVAIVVDDAIVWSKM